MRIETNKSAFVAIVGRPSSGKSTLLNRVCGHKVSIVSPIPQTTRNKIRGIYNCPEGQLVFLDTPGFHVSEKKLNTFLRALTYSALDDADLALYVADVSRRPGEEEMSLLSMLAKYRNPTIIALNKTDQPHLFVEEFRREIATRFPVEPITCLISGLEGHGIPELLDTLIERAPQGDLLYPEEFYTDQTPEFRVSEVVREKAIQETSQEVPHALYVEIADMEMRNTATLWVRGFVCVERESQKGILVGKGGRKIQQIRLAAERELNTLFPYTVRLDLRVKVRPKWRKKDILLRRITG